MAWDRVYGQNYAKTTFLAALGNGRLGQAYLFLGPEGVGKSLFALELAKSLLCEQPVEVGTACQNCSACLQVDARTHPDLFTLNTPEEKHELPVELIREFRAKLALKPMRGSRKIGIIEDADDFNIESANSFLKTLEEPPVGSLLLLLSTHLDRQLPTILSRCQVIRFTPLSAEEIRALLKQKGIVEPTEVERLVRLSRGSAGLAIALADAGVTQLRKALLEQIIAPTPNVSVIYSCWMKFVEEAGKESAAQRQRAKLILSFIIEWLSLALRIASGADLPDSEVDSDLILSFAQQLGVDGIIEKLDRCLEADRFIERRVPLGLVLEHLLTHIFAKYPA